MPVWFNFLKNESLNNRVILDTLSEIKKQGYVNMIEETGRHIRKFENTRLDLYEDIYNSEI